VISLCAGLFAALYAFLISSDVFVLSEARTYVLHGATSYPMTAQQYFLLPEGLNRRWTSMLAFNLEHSLFGPSITGMNFFQSALAGLCALLATFHAWQITRRWTIACGALAIWLFSGPTLNAILWQAVQHDKLAFASALLTMIAAHAALAKPRGMLLSTGFALLLPFLTAIAFNAKEIAFLLPVTVVALCAHLWLTEPDFRWRRALPIALPQLAYSAWYIRTYFANLKDSWAAYSMQGSATKGVRALGEHALNLGNFMNLRQAKDNVGEVLDVAVQWYRIAGIVLAALFVVALVRQYWPALRGGRAGVLQILREDSAAAYFVVWTALIVGAAARTSVPNAFYMLPAMWSGGALVLLLIDRCARSFPGRPVVFAALTALVLAPYGYSYTVHFRPYGAVSRIHDASRALMAACETLRSNVPPRKVRTLRFVFTRDAGVEYYLFTGIYWGKVDQDLGPFLFRDDAARPKLELYKLASWNAKNVDPEKAALWGAVLNSPLLLQAHPETFPGELTVFLDPQYRIIRALFEGRDIILTATP
jgi:hypothetical protein